jgi:hypothetical protein
VESIQREVVYRTADNSTIIISETGELVNDDDLSPYRGCRLLVGCYGSLDLDGVSAVADALICPETQLSLW